MTSIEPVAMVSGDIFDVGQARSARQAEGKGREEPLCNCGTAQAAVHGASGGQRSCTGADAGTGVRRCEPMKDIVARAKRFALASPPVRNTGEERVSPNQL